MEPEVALGQEVSIEDKPAWESLMPTAGQVLEVHMNSTSLDVLHDSWAGFFIDRVELHEGGSVSLHVRLIGAEDQTIANALGKFTDSGRLSIHLCRSRPCAEVMQEQHVQLHVTRVRLFSFPEYINSADYVSAGQKKLSKGWHRYLEKKQKDDVESRTKSTPGRGHGRGRGGLPARGSKPNPSKAPGDGLGQDRETPEISESMKRKLKEKLREVKDRVVPKNANKGAESHSSADEDSETGLEDDYSESVLEPPKLTGGTELVPQPPALEDLGIGGRGHHEKSTVKKKKKKKKEKEEAATKGISSSSLRGQLVQRAVLATQTRKAARKHLKKKKNKESTAKKLSDALTMILTKSTKKKKKNRKRHINAEGVIESCSATSSSSSGSDEDEAISSDDLETPMRKRSRDHPGSVLQLLTDHVKDQLQQSATTEVEDTESSLTSGVKVMTYFMLQLRPHFQGYQREMRELHHLSACIDALRRGDVATTGDALAGRFIALHQSMIDQNWQTAKHMEIFPMEESSAANTAMVLATRKHSRLVAKAQGLTYQPTWNPRGKGRGKGDWNHWNDSKGDGKGEKGKGKKGKGKGKYKQSWGEAGQGEWNNKKERPEEKQT